MQLSEYLGLSERTVSNVCSDQNEEKGKKKGTTPQHTSLSDVNLCWTIFKIILVCGFVFLWFWPESLFSVWDIFLGFFFLLSLFLPFCCIVPLEELVCFLSVFF